MKKSLTFPIVTTEEFKKILLDQLVENHKDYTTEDLFRDFLKDGFPKLDFENLGKSLEKMFVVLPTMFVDISGTSYCWIVSGSDAIVVNKTFVVCKN
jgi:hypothetical protein